MVNPAFPNHKILRSEQDPLCPIFAVDFVIYFFFVDYFRGFWTRQVYIPKNALTNQLIFVCAHGYYRGRVFSPAEQRGGRSPFTVLVKEGVMVLRPKHLRAMDLLASTDLLKREVASAVGVSANTLGRWCKDASFCEELARRRLLQPEQIDVLRLQAARSALTRVVRRLDSGYAGPSIREISQLLGRLVGDDFTRALPIQFRADSEPCAPAEETPKSVESALAR